ncbi:MAG: hypothetical protein MJ077_11110, partial [Oscillospiraceae bacterium]|nr:hypothetical protein [Oscillospiraceae bacterium]
MNRKIPINTSCFFENRSKKEKSEKSAAPFSKNKKEGAENRAVLPISHPFYHTTGVFSTGIALKSQQSLGRKRCSWMSFQLH